MIVKSTIILQASELSEREWVRLFSKLTFFDAKQQEVKTYKRLSGARVRIPRGAWNLLPDHVRYVDQRVLPRRARKLNFLPILGAEGRTGQQEAAQAALDEEQGLVIAQPGFGKTQVALAVIAKVKTPWIVFVHTEDIFNQWVEYAQKAIPNAEIGMIQGPRWEVKDVTIAMVQTVGQNLGTFRRDFADKFGGVVVDEAHHAPAETWELILNACPARYRLGFTATESRADGMQPFMAHLLGPVIYRQKFSSPIPVRVVPLKTGFKFPYRGHYDWMRLQAAMERDPARNRLIAETAVRQVTKGHSTLVLSRRVKHLTNIYDQMALLDEDIMGGVVILTGKVPRPRRKQIMEQFRAGEIRCLLATQLADEALDVPILSRVILAWIGKHDGRIIQQIGRALRPHDDKTDAAIIDMVDDTVSILRKHWMERKETYKKLGIKVMKLKNEEVHYVSQAAKRRDVAHRIRQRLASGRRDGRAT
jgi:superfamily II DNA or RNA helicase